MILEPGLLNDLSNEGQSEWEAYVAEEISAAAAQSGSSQFVMPSDPDLLPDITPIDWRGLPVRIRECLQSENRSYAFLDWIQNGQPFGRILGAQEEYLEWRVTRNPNGKIIRIELTSETPEYWRILAKHHPMRALRILADFAGESDPADAMDVYGVADPFGLSADDRESAFVSMMFPQEGNPNISSPYNNGQRAIAFMAVGPNTLHAAIFLAAFASIPYVKSDGGSVVPLTGREAIRFTRQAAQDCRDSDPTIVGSVVNLAVQKRKLSLANPPGLYIADVDHASILMPDEETSIPRDWFTFQRGAKIMNGGTSFSLSQRLVFEVPRSTGLTISDLIDESTGTPIEHGAQIASRITVAIYALASSEAVVDVPNREIAVAAVPPCRDDNQCPRVNQIFEFFEQSQQLGSFVNEPISNVRGSTNAG